MQAVVASSVKLRGGLVFKAHRLAYHATLDSSVIKKKKIREGSNPLPFRTIVNLRIVNLEIGQPVALLHAGAHAARQEVHVDCLSTMPGTN